MQGLGCIYFQYSIRDADVIRIHEVPCDGMVLSILY